MRSEMRASCAVIVSVLNAPLRISAILCRIDRRQFVFPQMHRHIAIHIGEIPIVQIARAIIQKSLVKRRVKSFLKHEKKFHVLKKP